VPLVPGAFGENVTTHGMTERDVCIGDVYRAGTALLQVSQGRQPCWKLNRRFERPDAALSMQRSGATGWYYRVLQEGAIAPGDALVLVERPCPDWPLDRLIRALFPADAAAPGLADEWGRAASLAPLAPNWRTAFARRVGTGRIEDWSRRLAEP
jgi:MOSC domain-containing protein YiiM